MSITLDLPKDVESQVSGIPDLDLRLLMFLRHEAHLEQVRRARFGDEARGIAERALRAAAVDQTEGFAWDESSAKLRRAQSSVRFIGFGHV
jgi:hypothetical protein